MALQGYVAVKFLHKEDGDRYAFVPKFWIVAQCEPDNTIVVAYPAEPSLAQQHMDKEPSADWEQHSCELLYTTDDYEEIKKDITLRNKEARREKSKNESKCWRCLAQCFGTIL